MHGTDKVIGAQKDATHQQFIDHHEIQKEMKQYDRGLMYQVDTDRARDSAENEDNQLDWPLQNQTDNLDSQTTTTTSATTED